MRFCLSCHFCHTPGRPCARTLPPHAHATQIRQWLKTDKCKVKLQLIASIVEKCQRRPCNPAAVLERIIPDIAAGLNGSPRTSLRTQTAAVGHRGLRRPTEAGAWVYVFDVNGKKRKRKKGTQEPSLSPRADALEVNNSPGGCCVWWDLVRRAPNHMSGRRRDQEAARLRALMSAGTN